MKNKFAALAAGCLLGLSLLSGGLTYALFNATTTNSGNTFTAGTVSFDSFRDQADSKEIPGPMFYGLVDDPTGRHPYDTSTSFIPYNECPGEWAPGDTVTRMLNIDNKGTLDAKFTKIKAVLESIKDKDGNTLAAGTQAYNDFMAHMNIKVYSPADGYTTPVYNGSLANLLSGYQSLAANMCLPVGTTAWDVKFVASMDISAGNDLQGVKGVFTFDLLAEQMRNNP